MDPLTIVGVVSNILSFISFSHEIVSSTKKIYSSTSGSTDDVIQLRKLVEDIQQSTQNASKELKTTDDAARESLRGINQMCTEIAENLIQELDGLEAKGKGMTKKINAIKVSMKMSQKMSKIDASKNRLLELEGRVNKWWTDSRNSEQYQTLSAAVGDLSESMKQLGARQSDAVAELTELLTQVDQNIRNLKDQADHYKKVLRNSPPAGKKSGKLPADEKTAKTEDTLNKMQISHMKRLTMTTQNVERLMSQFHRARQQESVIRSLRFASDLRRFGDIAEAHEDTLEWVYDKAKTNFIEWLEFGAGTFWINGRAGSGKSTLMKFVSGHETTSTALKLWAGNKAVVIASHYFWHSGIDMQKSQQGLFQTLLYHILRSAPQLVDTICRGDRGPGLWDISELKATFERLREQQDLQVKFCFFIDGLDEYDGAEEDIISVINSLARSSHTKVCVSSRPWPAFSAEWLNSKHTLAVQEHTYDDMVKYIDERLVRDSRFQDVASQDKRCFGLAKIITERADGVWIWVFLAIRDLLRDMRDEEPYDSLMERLNSYPQELEEYFEDIMSRIDPLRASESAQIFLLVSTAVRPLSILTLTFLDVWEKPELALSTEVKPVSDQFVTKEAKVWRPRLQNRCRDLLKITVADSETPVFKYQIDFLHRTVRDFLRVKHEAKLHEKVPVNFEANVTLSRLVLIFIKTLDVPDFSDSMNTLLALVDELLLYAWSVEQLPPAKYSAALQVDLLNDLDKALTIHSQGESRHWTNARDSPSSNSQELWAEEGGANFVALTIQARLHLYVQHMLSHEPSLVKKSGRPLLDYALRPKRITPVVLPYNVHYGIPWLDVVIVETLLKSKQSPNKKIHIYENQTIWVLFLMSCRKNWGTWSASAKETIYASIELLIKHGADLNATVPPVRRQPQEARSMGRWNEPAITANVSDESVTAAQLLRGLARNWTEGPKVLTLIEQGLEKEKQIGLHRRVLGFLGLTVFG